MLVIKKCETCGTEFETNIPHKRFCSQKCNDIARLKRDKIEREKVCIDCGETFMGTRNAQKCKHCILKMKSKAGKAMRNSRTEEQLKEISNNNSIRMKERYANATEEDMEKREEKRLAGWRDTWNTMDDEKKQYKLSKLHQGADNYRINETEEQKSERIKKQSESFKKTYYSKTEEERNDWHKKGTEGRKKWLSSLNEEQYKEYVQSHIDSMKKGAIDRLQRTGYMYPCQYPHVRESSKAFSKVNKKIYEDFKNAGIDIECEYTVGRFTYDFKIGDTLIEINPYPYHNTTRNPGGRIVSKTYHYDKTIEAHNNGFKCIHIFDWDDLDKVKHMFSKKTTIYARNCEVKHINNEECNSFFEEFHLQGGTKHNKNNMYIGLLYKGEIVECMSFGKPRYNKNYEWEILRLCSNNNYTIVGGASKIFSFFLKQSQAKSVISYCDMSKFDGNVYKSLGFKLLKWNEPSRHWYRAGSMLYEGPKHITDNLLRQKGFDMLLGKYFGEHGKGTDNNKLMEEAGFVSIYDSGQATFVL